MPIITKHQPESNGSTSSEKRGLPSKFKQMSTDEVTIGSDTEYEGEIEVCTAAEAAKIVGETKFLIPVWMPYALLTGVIAEPGKGKSALLLWLARTIMTAGTWFNG